MTWWYRTAAYPTGLFFVFGIRGENHCSCVTLVTFAFLITR